MKIINKIKNFDKKGIVKKAGLGLALVTLVGLISAVSVNLNAHDCKLTNSYRYDSTSHYYECTENKWCNKKFQEEEHELVWVVDREETFDTNGLKHRECKCGYRTNNGTVIDNFYYDVNAPLDNDLSANNITLTANENYKEFSQAYGKFDNLDNRNVSFSAKVDLTYADYSNISSVFRKCDVKYNIYDKEGFKQSINFHAACDNGSYLTISDVILSNTEIKKLGNDFIINKMLLIDFGSYYKENYGWVYGFRFKTVNYEITYLSDNSGNLKNSDISNKLSWISEDGIYNDYDGTKAIDFTVIREGYTQGGVVPSLTLTCNKGSVWFVNQANYIVYKNNIETK